jgi:biopolymer transport protein ExbD
VLSCSGSNKNEVKVMKNYLIKSLVLVCLSLLISAFCFAQDKADPRAGKRKIDPNSKPVIFTLAKNGEIALGSEKITTGKVTDKVNRLMEMRSPEKEIVYILAESDKSYGEIADFIKLARKAQVSDFGFLIVEEAERDVATAVNVKVRSENHAKSGDAQTNPAAVLIVELGAERRVSLNSKPMLLENLTDTLSQTFEQRKQNGVFRAGTNRVETAVFIKAAPEAKFGEVMKVIRTVKNAGAHPISLDIDSFAKR